MVWTLLAAAICVFVFHARIYWGWTEDDAFITFRYAQNLAGGRGLVFNPGERVEGYSNPSLLLISAAALRAGLDPVIVAKWLGLAAGALCLLLSWLLARRMAQDAPLAALVAPFYLAVSPALARHAVTGLETTLFALLLTAGVLLAAGDRSPLRRALFLVIALLISITRPEGPAFALFLLVAGAVIRGRGPGGSRRGDWAEPGILVLFLAAYASWRWSYFGSFFPNAYYAKVQGGVSGIIDGAQYTLDFLRDAGGPFLAGLALVTALVGCATAAYGVALACLVLYVAFIIVSGGDWMFHYRFFAHVLPVASACMAAGIASIVALAMGLARRGRVLLYACLAFLLGVTCLSVGNTELRVARMVLPALEERTYLSQSYEALGRWFHENSAPEATVAISDIGAVGYYSGRRVIDMFGLIDRRIARIKGRMHYKADPQYVLSRNPDYIVLVSSSSAGIRPSFLRIPDRVMSAEPAFTSRYELVRTVPLHWQNESVGIYKLR